MDHDPFIDIHPKPERGPASPFELTDAELVGQSIALAVQDAVSHLRSVEALSVAVTGVALNGLVQSGDPRYKQALGAISTVVNQAATNFRTITQSAERLLAADHPGLEPYDEVVTDTFTEKVLDEFGNQIDERIVPRVTKRRTTHHRPDEPGDDA